MLMDSLTLRTLTLIVICAALQEGRGRPVSEPGSRHVRAKRCSCSNWDDKECIYFCHLDIIWVNTPSKLLPYGLGSPLSRRRRSADRCGCVDPADKTCSSFCRQRPQAPSSGAVSPQGKSADSNKLLASLRSVVKSNLNIARDALKVSGVDRLKSRTRR